MHLCCHSYFSLKYGVLSPDDLLCIAAQKNIQSLALTDINNTSGILDFFRLAQRYNVRPVAGIDFRNGVEQKFIGIAKSNEGFHELNKFLSEHLISGEKFSDIAPAFQQAWIVTERAHWV